MRRVTVLLPFVPVIEIAVIRRSASRTQAGGVVRAAAIRSIQRATIRSWLPVRRARFADETSRSVRASAASAIVRARSAPVQP